MKNKIDLKLNFVFTRPEMSLFNKVPKEVYPLFVFTGAVMSFAAYRMYKVSQLPETQFRRKNEDFNFKETKEH